MNLPDVWPQVTTGIIVSACSIIVTKIVQAAAKKLENVATKDFVVDQLKIHGDVLERRIDAMFVRSSTQSLVNADVEARLRRVEDSYRVRLPELKTS